MPPETGWTYEQIIDNLWERGYHWNSVIGQGVSLTYSFMTANPTGYYLPDFAPFTEAQKQATRYALARWAEVANVTFTEVTGSSGTAGNIVLANSSITTTGATQRWVYTGTNQLALAAIFISPHYQPNQWLDPGEYGLNTLAHEIGHALGLPNPGDYNYTPGGYISWNNDAWYVEDTHSIMSYLKQSDYAQNPPATDGYSAGPLLHDIGASRRLGPRPFG